MRTKEILAKKSGPTKTVMMTPKRYKEYSKKRQALEKKVMKAWTKYIEFGATWRDIEFDTICKMGDIKNELKTFKSLRSRVSKKGTK